MSTVPALPRRTAAPSLLPASGDTTLAAHLARYGPLPRVARRDRELLAAVEAGGLRGRGGAAFPTAIKLAAVGGRRFPSVLANALEGEPASRKDAELIARNPHLVLDGLETAARLVGARERVLVVDRAMQLAPLERALAEREQRTRLVRLPARFVAGEESALVAAARGDAARPTGRRPFAEGVLVANVETLAHLALIARHGPAAHRARGSHAEPGALLATVGGAVALPGVVEMHAGMRLGQLLEACRGLAEPASAVLIGGYSGSWFPLDSDLVLSDGHLRHYGASLGARVFWVLPRRACGLREVARVTRWLAGESAGQCGPCVFGLAALADAVDAVASGGDGVDAALARIAALTPQIAGRGGCAHPDGVLGFVRSALETFAAELDAHRGGACSGMLRGPVLPLARAQAAA